MAADPRLGVRTVAGQITEWPEQYYDGSVFAIISDPAPSLVFFNTTTFAALKPGVAEIPTAVYNALAAIAGTGSVLSTYASLMAEVGLTGTALESESVFDDFEGASLNARWATDIGSGTASLTVPGTSGYTQAHLYTGTSDNQWATLALADVKYLANSDLTLLECRVRLDTLTEVVIEVGFSDAESETAGLAFSSHDATPVAVANNAAVLAFHHDTGTEELTAWSACVSNGGVAAREDTGTAVTASNGFQTIVVALARNGSDVDAGFYINGVQKVVIEEAVNGTAILNPWFSVVTKTTAGRTLGIDYVRSTSDRT